jgi:hypothetical protein
MEAIDQSGHGGTEVLFVNPEEGRARSRRMTVAFAVTGAQNRRSVCPGYERIRAVLRSPIGWPRVGSVGVFCALAKERESADWAALEHGSALSACASGHVGDESLRTGLRARHAERVPNRSANSSVGSPSVDGRGRFEPVPGDSIDREHLRCGRAQLIPCGCRCLSARRLRATRSSLPVGFSGISSRNTISSGAL